MMTLISAVTTSVIINVTTKVMATAAPVESSSSDSSSSVNYVDKWLHISQLAMYIQLTSKLHSY